MGIITEEDFDKKLLPAVPKKYRTNVILQRMCGLRASETNLTLQIRKKDKNGKTISFFKPKKILVHPPDFEKETITIFGKNNKEREVPIPTKWISMEEVERHYTIKKPLSYNAYYTMLVGVFKKIGHSPPRSSSGKNTMITHCLREYFIKDYCNFYKIENGYTNLKFLMKITGLQSLDDVEPYLKNLNQKDEYKPFRDFMK